MHTRSGFMVVLLMSTLVSARSMSSARPECEVWARLEQQTLALQDKGHANCSTNHQCTGFHCKGVYLGQPIVFGMRVLPCQPEIGVEIYGSAPQFHAKNFTHIFTHDDHYEVPGALLNLSLGQRVRGSVRVHLARVDAHTVEIGLTALGHVEDVEVFEKSIFNRTHITVPKCRRVTNDVCQLAAMNMCGDNMMCEQTDPQSHIGLCTCQRGFAEREDGTCVSASAMSDASPELQQDLSGSSWPSVSRTPRQSATSSSAIPQIMALSLLLLLVLVLIASLLYLGLRTRLFHRIRARLTNSPYEDIVIGRQQQQMRRSQLET